MLLLNTTSSSTATKAFPFFDLPPELREKIYLLLFVSPRPLSLFFSSKVPAYFPHDLLLTCSQMYQEVRPLFFAYNRFTIRLTRHCSELDYFLSPDFLDARRSIRTLHLLLSRWGSNSFFARTLAPFISDMILNGSLRNFEIAVKIHTQRKFEEMMVAGGEVYGEGHENFEAVKELLTDPYLESKALWSGPIVTLDLFDSELMTWDEMKLEWKDVSWMVGLGCA
ncbi:hypothetical protein BGZ60DRAFT_525020 [Tricladium varicosporioides]|nr:hypothetical protein BGZ60DRAFT_525020 [Hymenoscyphus varicosporioides]